MADRVNVKLSVEVVDAQNETPFMDASLNYSGVPYDAFVMMEKSVMDMFTQWGVWGLEKYKAKKDK